MARLTFGGGTADYSVRGQRRVRLTGFMTDDHAVSTADLARIVQTLDRDSSAADVGSVRACQTS